VLSAPQCVHRAQLMTSVFDRSSMVLSTSPTGTVRITAPHSLQTISAFPSLAMSSLLRFSAWRPDPCGCSCRWLPLFQMQGVFLLSFQ
jgi:hypothetical protein